VSPLTLEGPSVTVAEPSALVTVPPSVGETTVVAVGGGESPLAVLAVGSGSVGAESAGGVSVGGAGGRDEVS
jgi:hypothetical protein